MLSLETFLASVLLNGVVSDLDMSFSEAEFAPVHSSTCRSSTVSQKDPRNEASLNKLKLDESISMQAHVHFHAFFCFYGSR